MKITLNETEMMNMIRKSFPKEMIPADHEITNVTQTGPSYSKEYSITVMPKEVVTNG
jgi:hypothetical protein